MRPWSGFDILIMVCLFVLFLYSCGNSEERTEYERIDDMNVASAAWDYCHEWLARTGRTWVTDHRGAERRDHRTGKPRSYSTLRREVIDHCGIKYWRKVNGETD